MGKINAGLHGKITNKVGGVVYRITHGQNTVSEYQPEIHDLKSEAQLIQRLKFGNLTKFLKWFGSEFLLLSFLFAKNKLSGFANAIKKNMQAMNDDGTIDSTKLKLTANNDPFKPTVIATYNRFLDRCETTVTNQNIFINKATGAVSFIINSFRPGQSTNINDDEWVDFFYCKERDRWVCAWNEPGDQGSYGYWNDLGNGFLEGIEYFGQWDEGMIHDPNYNTYPIIKWANSVIVPDRSHDNYPKPVKLFTAEVKTKVR